MSRSFPAPMLLCIGFVAAAKPPHERLLYNQTTRPRELEPMMELSFPVIVLFRNKECEACTSFAAGLQNVAQKILGWAVLTQVNCELNSSAKFCQKFKVKEYPTLMLLNPNPDQPNTPKWDFEEDFSDKAFIEWIYENRKPIFAVSPKPEAYIAHVNENPDQPNMLFVTKGLWPPIFMNAVRTEISKISQHFSCVQQPDFGEQEAEAMAQIPGGEKLVAGQHQIAFYRDGSLEVYSGPMQTEAVVAWFKEKMQATKREV